MLEMHLQATDDGSRQVVFLDELPWMDTPRSSFVTALESLWQAYLRNEIVAFHAERM